MMTQFTVLGAPRGKERPRAAKLRDRTVVYTPKKTRDYERNCNSLSDTVQRYVFRCGICHDMCILQIPKSTSRKRVLEMIADEIKPTKT